jgi:hypothetical protein
MTAVVWVDELPSGKTKTSSDDIAAFAATLRQRPLQWAVYPWSAALAPVTRKNRASDINHSRASAPLALRRGFEAAVRGDVMYVRYIGRPVR